MEYDVIIIGGGVSGLSAAQELVKQNLKICVLEAAPFVGGKPISAFVSPLKPPPQSASKEMIDQYLHSLAERNNEVQQRLPIEHGFRVYPENYNNLMKIMREISVEEGKCVEDYFTNEIELAKHIKIIPKNAKWTDRFLSVLEKYFFGLALYTPYILCEKRSLQYDEISIEKLFDLKNRSKELKECILMLTDSLSSGMPSKTSCLAVINILMNFYYAPNREKFRTFNRPTHLAWLQPWENHLIKNNVQIYKNTRVEHIQLMGYEEGNQAKIAEVVAIQDNVKKSSKQNTLFLLSPLMR